MTYILTSQRLRNLVFFCLTVVFVVITKFFYRNADSTGLLFILKPVTAVVSFALNQPFEFVGAPGYSNLDGSVLIGPSCAGINFMIILFAMLTFTFIPVFNNFNRKLLTYLLILISSYLIAILVNASRIITSITILKYNLLEFFHDGRLVHKGVGILIYFFYLVLCYFISLKIIDNFIRRKSYETGI